MIFEASLVYIASFKTARTTKKTLSQNKNRKTQENNNNNNNYSNNRPVSNKAEPHRPGIIILQGRNRTESLWSAWVHRKTYVSTPRAGNVAQVVQDMPSIAKALAVMLSI